MSVRWSQLKTRGNYYVLFSFRDLSGIIFNFAASEDIMNACKGRKPTCKLQVTAMATG